MPTGTKAAVFPSRLEVACFRSSAEDAVAET
jgi:hypothetical protein